MAWSSAALEELLGEVRSATFVFLLTITDASLAAPIRFARSFTPIVSRGSTFLPLTFEISLPDERPDRPWDCKVMLDDVNRQLVQAVRELPYDTAAEVLIELIIQSEPDTVQRRYKGTMRKAEYDIRSLEVSIAAPSIINIGTGRIMTPHAFPGVHVRR